MKKFFVLMLLSSAIYADNFYYKGKMVGRSSLKGTKEYFFDEKGKVLGSADAKGSKRFIYDSKGKQIGSIQSTKNPISPFFKLRGVPSK